MCETIKKDDQYVRSGRSALLLMPGLGLSSAIFQKLELTDYELIFLEWMAPKFNETIESYSQRLIADTDLTNYNSVSILGHSMGGIIAQEIAQIISIDHLFLVSTIMNAIEKPKKFHLIKRMPNFLLKKSKWFIRWSFPFWAIKHGYTSKTLRNIFKQSVFSLPPYYFYWSMVQILSWSGTALNCSVFRIHGCLDKTFPASLIVTDVTLLKEGDHMMIFNQADDISKLINNYSKNSRLPYE